MILAFLTHTFLYSRSFLEHLQAILFLFFMSSGLPRLIVHPLEHIVYHLLL